MECFFLISIPNYLLKNKIAPAKARTIKNTVVPPFFAALKRCLCALYRALTAGLLLFPPCALPDDLPHLRMPKRLSAGGRFSLGRQRGYSFCSQGLNIHKAACFAKQPCMEKVRLLVVLLLGHIDDLHAVIVTAILAHAVGELLFVALRAFHDAGQAQLPIGATAAATGLGHFSLRKSHCYTSSFRPPEHDRVSNRPLTRICFRAEE